MLNDFIAQMKSEGFDELSTIVVCNVDIRNMDDLPYYANVNIFGISIDGPINKPISIAYEVTPMFHSKDDLTQHIEGAIDSVKEFLKTIGLESRYKIIVTGIDD